MSRALFVCSVLNSASTCILMLLFLSLCHSATLSPLLSSYSYSLSLYLYRSQLAILVQLTRRRTSASKGRSHSHLNRLLFANSFLLCAATAFVPLPPTIPLAFTPFTNHGIEVLTGLTSSTLFTFNSSTVRPNSLRCCMGEHQYSYT